MLWLGPMLRSCQQASTCSAAAATGTVNLSTPAPKPCCQHTTSHCAAHPLCPPADGLKLYPTLVIRGTGLYELWKKGLYRNYPPDKVGRHFGALRGLVRVEPVAPQRYQLHGGLASLLVKRLLPHPQPASHLVTPLPPCLPPQLVDLVARILAYVPPWVRIYRIQRDIPMPLVSSGVEKGNLRELALARMGHLG